MALGWRHRRSYCLGLVAWREEGLAQPGTPEYEAFFQEMLHNCVADSIQKDRAEKNSIVSPMSKREHEEVCRAAITRALDLYPGVRPARKVSN
jgi:hypothetical protein